MVSVVDEELRKKLDAIAALAARASLSEFVRQAWPIVEPGTKLVWNWHIDVICDALQRQIEGDQDHRKLLIVVPPGFMKSLLVSVFAPAWEWLGNPCRRKLFLANDDEVCTRDSMRMHQIVTSPWYASLTGDRNWSMRRDQDAKTNYANNRGGVRICQSVNSAITGKRADDIVLDDLVDAKFVSNGSGEQIRRRMQHVANIVDRVLPNRVNDLSTARWTMIMQRLHVEDPAGLAMREGGWKLIQIQMEFEPSNACNHQDDPRKELGELAFSSKFPRNELDLLRTKMSLRHYNAQYQATPTLDQGDFMRREWFDETKWETTPPMSIYIVGDFAVTTPEPDSEPDYTELGVFGLAADSHLYVLDWWFGQATSATWIDVLVGMMKRWKPRVFFGEKGVIKNSVAPFLLKRMREQGVWVRLEWLTCDDDKQSRAIPLQAMAESKRVHLPKDATWTQRAIEQLVDFPAGAHDDIVDTLAHMCRAINMQHPAIKSAPPPNKKRDAYIMANNDDEVSWKTA